MPVCAGPERERVIERVRTFVLSYDICLREKGAIGLNIDPGIRFGTIDWDEVAPERHEGITGYALYALIPAGLAVAVMMRARPYGLRGAGKVQAAAHGVVKMNFPVTLSGPRS